MPQMPTPSGTRILGEVVRHGALGGADVEVAALGVVDRQVADVGGEQLPGAADDRPQHPIDVAGGGEVASGLVQGQQLALALPMVLELAPQILVGHFHIPAAEQCGRAHCTPAPHSLKVYWQATQQEESMGIQVGVDVGGTFTDAAVAADGEVVRAKAYSTRDVTSGILDALSRVRQQLELVRGRVLRRDRQVRPGQHDRHQRDRRAAVPAGRAAHHRRLQGHAADRALGARPLARRPPAHRAARSSCAATASSRSPSASTSTATCCARPIRTSSAAGVQLAPRPGRRRDRRLLPVVVQEPGQRAGGRPTPSRELAPELPLTLSSELAPVYREYERMVDHGPGRRLQARGGDALRRAADGTGSNAACGSA